MPLTGLWAQGQCPLAWSSLFPSTRIDHCIPSLDPVLLPLAWAAPSYFWCYSPVVLLRTFPNASFILLMNCMSVYAACEPCMYLYFVTGSYSPAAHYRPLEEAHTNRSLPGPEHTCWAGVIASPRLITSPRNLQTAKLMSGHILLVSYAF